MCNFQGNIGFNGRSLSKSLFRFSFRNPVSSKKRFSCLRGYPLRLPRMPNIRNHSGSEFTSTSGQRLSNACACSTLSPINMENSRCGSIGYSPSTNSSAALMEAISSFLKTLSGLIANSRIPQPFLENTQFPDLDGSDHKRPARYCAHYNRISYHFSDFYYE